MPRDPIQVAGEALRRAARVRAAVNVEINPFEMPQPVAVPPPNWEEAAPEVVRPNGQMNPYDIISAHFVDGTSRDWRWSRELQLYWPSQFHGGDPVGMACRQVRADFGTERRFIPVHAELNPNANQQDLSADSMSYWRHFRDSEAKQKAMDLISDERIDFTYYDAWSRMFVFHFHDDVCVHYYSRDMEAINNERIDRLAELASTEFDRQDYVNAFRHIEPVRLRAILRSSFPVDKYEEPKPVKRKKLPDGHIDGEIQYGTFMVFEGSGQARHGTADEWVAWCKQVGRKPHRNMPAISNATATQLRKIQDAGWLVDGAKKTSCKCANCNLVIQDIPPLVYLFERTSLCFRCATGTGREFVSRIHRNPRDVSVSGTDTFGIEVEANPSLEMLMTAHSLGWGIKPDGSLRGLSAEIVSPILTLDNLEEETNAVFKGKNAVLNNRCGYHAWVGSKHIKYAGVGKLARYSAIWESQFTRLVSPTREPASKTDSSGRPIKLPRTMCACPLDKSGIMKYFYGQERLWQESPDGRKVLRFKESKRCNDRADNEKPWLNVMYPGGVLSRYQWINFHGHFYRGAIEVRLHQGTVNPEAIVNWALLWHNIINEVPSMSLDLIEKTHPLQLAPNWLRNYYTELSKMYDKMKKIPEKFTDFVDTQIIFGNKED